ncbi:ParB/RepB/Spo0J family partition protein, partial [filamentous cyanobacterium LEGE 11480]
APNNTLPLAQIQPRIQDTRELNPIHVETLAESIAVLGLIEPLVVDDRGQLLAGGHRLAAIQHLQTRNPDAYEAQFPNDQIPVRSLPIDAEQDPALALQIEVAENEQRRDYTPAEVKALADRLKDSGYTEVKGRPKRGQKPLMPALAVVVGKNLRTVQRYLAEGEASAEAGTAKTTTSKSTTHVVLLKQTLKKLHQIQDNPPKGRKGKQLLKTLPAVMDLLEQCIEDG